MKIQDISDAMSFIDGHINYEKQDKIPYKEKFSYNFILNCLNYLDIDYRSFKIIHVAGTNGKGSIVTILSHLIGESGFSVGSFLSPHIFVLNERILINNKPIEDDMLIEATRIYSNISKDFSYKASFFEVLTLIALISFSLCSCEYIVLETGLGGRLDTTNFADDKLSIISTVDYDHIGILGEDIAEIAKEKAGIIKSNNIVILGKQRKEIYRLLMEKSRSVNAKLYSYGEDFRISNLSCYKAGIIFYVHFSLGNSFRIKAPLLSINQSLNIAISLKALKLLNISFTESSINIGLGSLSLLGRFQYFFKYCHIVLDGAHNRHSISYLILNLKLRYRNSRYKWIILGINMGKDYISIIEEIGNFFDYIIVCPLPIKIKQDISKDIFKSLCKVHKRVYYKNSIYEAYKYISPHLKKEDLLVITGSFYLIGEAFNIIKSYNRKENISL